MDTSLTDDAAHRGPRNEDRSPALPGRLIFVASLAHSGSTLLDLVLGGHSRMVGIGEAFRLLEPLASRPLDLATARAILCSCRQTLDLCPLWSPVLDDLASAGLVTPEEGYRITLQRFAEVFGADRIPVDSSKTLSALRAVARVADVDVEVIHLIRDVRSWVVSTQDAARRKADTVPARSSNRSMKNSAAYLFLHWYRHAQALQSSILGMNLHAYEVSYEELSMYSKEVLSDLCDSLSVSFEEEVLSIGRSSSHSILGNRMRFQEAKLAAIRYDTRWMSRRNWVLPSLLYRNIMDFNTIHVHGRAHREWSA